MRGEDDDLGPILGRAGELRRCGVRGQGLGFSIPDTKASRRSPRWQVRPRLTGRRRSLTRCPAPAARLPWDRPDPRWDRRAVLALVGWTMNVKSRGWLQWAGFGLGCTILGGAAVWLLGRPSATVSITPGTAESARPPAQVKAALAYQQRMANDPKSVELIEWREVVPAKPISFVASFDEAVYVTIRDRNRFGALEVSGHLFLLQGGKVVADDPDPYGLDRHVLYYVAPPGDPEKAKKDFMDLPSRPNPHPVRL